MKEKLTTFDPAEYIRTEDDAAEFMRLAFETGDAAYIAHAVGVVARAKGMSELARQTGLSREQLYRSFSEEDISTPSAFITASMVRSVGLPSSLKER